MGVTDLKTKDLGRTAIISLIFVVVSTILFIMNINEQEVLLIMLPIIYGLFYIGISKIHYYTNYPGMFTLNVIVFLRYVLLPILILLYPSYVDVYGKISEGILLMIFEALSLGVLLAFITKKYYQSHIKKNLSISNNKNLVIKMVVLYSIVVVVLQPNILHQYNFAFVDSSSIELIKGRSLVTGVNGMIVDLGKLLLPLLLTIPLIIKHRKKQNDIYYYATIIIIMLFNVLIFSGTSRSSMLIPAVASIFYLINAFPNKRKKIFMFMSFAIVVVVIQLTLLKTEYIGTKLSFSLGEIIDYLEAYFVGPKNMGVVIKAHDIYSSSYSISTFFNDVMGNFPGLSKFFDLENRTNTFYNLTFYNGGPQRDQIIPSMGQGLFYFGYIFSFLPQMLIIIGMAKLDELYSKSNSLAGVYFYSYFTVKFGFTFVQSLSSVLSFIYSIIIPITIIYVMNRKTNELTKVRRYSNEKSKITFCDK